MTEVLRVRYGRALGAALLTTVLGLFGQPGMAGASEPSAVPEPAPPEVSAAPAGKPAAEPATPIADTPATPEEQPAEPEGMLDENVPSVSEEMPPPDALETMSDEAFEALLLGTLAPLPAPESAAAPGDEFPADLEDLLDFAEQADPAPVQLQFNFRFQPWEDVLDWFAEQAGYSLVMDAAPPGTFNYADARSYTPAEAIDLLNSVLLTKGYTLVLRDRMLVLVNLDDGVPPNLVSTVTTEELDKRGEYELVSSLFELENLTAEEAQQEIERLIGPQGSVVVLPKARQVLVTETAGKLRTIRDVIQRADNPGDAGGEEVRWLDLQFASPEEVLTIFRQLFNIPVGQNAATDGSIRFAFDPLGMRLLVSGNAKKVEQVQKVLETIDVPGTGGTELAGAKSSLQLEVYDVTPADPEAALKVLQTLLAGLPGVRLSTDPKTGSIIALARPEDHATIHATLEQMQRDAQRMEVFRLRSLDPQLAILAISKLFSSEGTKAPSVDADPNSRQLLVRGRQAQIEQIRALLEKMGETGGGDYAATGSGNVRMIPLSGQGVGSALERLQEVWPMLHGNPVRVVTPSAVIPTLRGSGPPQPSLPESGVIDQRLVNPPPAPPNGGAAPQPAAPSDSSAAPTATQPVPAQPSTGDRSTRNSSPARPGGAKLFLASEPAAAGGVPLQPEVEPPLPPGTAEPAAAPKSNAPIVVALTPSGIMIASEDQDALNDFERLLGVLAGSVDSADSGPRATVFYLKHAKAQSAADVLGKILASAATRTVSAPSPAPSGQPGSPASPAASGMLGHMLGTGGAGGVSLTGPVQVTPDLRLNALVVQANPADVDTIEQILRVLDQKESPEDILAKPKPRLIPVYNTQASDVAEIVKQVYQDRMITGSGAGSSGGRPTNPMEMFQMLRGGRDGRDGRDGRSSSSSGTTDTVDRMSIGVDERTNSVVVCAPELLFQEVQQLVEQLDEAAGDKQESVRVVTLHGVSAQAAQQALAALMGDQVQSSTAGRSSSRSSSSSSSRSSSDRGSSDSSDWARRFQERMQFFRGGSSGSPFGGSSSSRRSSR